MSKSRQSRKTCARASRAARPSALTLACSFARRADARALSGMRSDTASGAASKAARTARARAEVRSKK